MPSSEPGRESYLGQGLLEVNTSCIAWESCKHAGDLDSLELMQGSASVLPTGIVRVASQWTTLSNQALKNWGRDLT